MNTTPLESTPDIPFMHITATIMNQICDLSDTLSPQHRRMVASLDQLMPQIIHVDVHSLSKT